MVRDIPLLKELTRYRLAPSEPSRYVIRREPNEQSISTLEATVIALRYLEPETQGLEQLLDAFLGMIDDQLSLPKSDYGLRRHMRRSCQSVHIPKLLWDRQQDVVVVYGETTPGTKGDRGTKVHRPVYWVAERLVSGERFECAIKPPMALSPSFLGHLELNGSVFEQAPTMDEFRNAWQAFVLPSDIIAFYDSNIQRLLLEIGFYSNPFLHLKCIKKVSAFVRESAGFDGVSAVRPTSNHNGRAGRRLASSVALARYLYAVSSH